MISANLPHTYIGLNGIAQYKAILLANESRYSYNTDYSYNQIKFLPLEDDDGSGVELYHFEEGGGINTYRQGSKIYNDRYYDDYFYPSIPGEIMSGWLNTGDTQQSSSNYITSLTLGILQDLGFGVDYNSSYILNTGTYLIPSPYRNISERYHK